MMRMLTPRKKGNPAEPGKVVDGAGSSDSACDSPFRRNIQPGRHECNRILGKRLSDC
jgi:hypothetical protein